MCNCKILKGVFGYFISIEPLVSRKTQDLIRGNDATA